MKEGKATVKNNTGLHARPASLFIAFVNKYKDSEILLFKDDKKANAKSILNLLALGVSKGSEILVQVNGGDEEQIVKEIVDFIENLQD